MKSLSKLERTQLPYNLSKRKVVVKPNNVEGPASLAVPLIDYQYTIDLAIGSDS